MSPRSAERRELFPAPTLPTTATREPRGIRTLMLSRVGVLLVFFSLSSSPLEVAAAEAELQAKEALEKERHELWKNAQQLRRKSSQIAL